MNNTIQSGKTLSCNSESMDGWTKTNPCKEGDIVTIAGLYEKRTFLEWLKRKPKKLKEFTVWHKG